MHECHELGCPQWTSDELCYFHDKVGKRLITGYFKSEQFKTGRTNEDGTPEVERREVWHALRLR